MTIAGTIRRSKAEVRIAKKRTAHSGSIKCNDGLRTHNQTDCDYNEDFRSAHPRHSAANRLF